MKKAAILRPFLLFCIFMNNKLPKEFYLNDDVCHVAKSLLGKELVVRFNNLYLSGMITETEAYAGISDKASHAYNNRRTDRTETMFAEGGVAYVYLCYGIHYLFNVVTNKQEIPDAVLVRSVFPVKGWTSQGFKNDLAKGEGPGRVSKILGITKQLNGLSLQGKEVFILNSGIHIPGKFIQAGKRIGVDYAGNDALLPYRFFIEKEYVKQIFER